MVSLRQLGIHIVELLPGCVDFPKELLVVTFVLFVVIALFRVQIVELGLVGEVDLVNLLFIRADLILHVTLDREKTVEVLALLIILVLDVAEERFNVLGLRIRTMLIQS